MGNEIRYGAASLLMIFSLIFLLTGIVGNFKFRDTLQRMHAAALNDTLGLGLGLLSLIIAEGADFVSLKFLLIAVFLCAASPVSSHLIARTEYLARKAEEREQKREGKG